jgi:hypothetical protein
MGGPLQAAPPDPTLRRESCVKRPPGDWSVDGDTLIEFLDVI